MEYSKYKLYQFKVYKVMFSYKDPLLMITKIKLVSRSLISLTLLKGFVRRHHIYSLKNLSVSPIIFNYCHGAVHQVTNLFIL